MILKEKVGLNSRANIAIAFGSGGHRAQAERLQNILETRGFFERENFYFIHESDVLKSEYLCQFKRITVPPLRDKYRKLKSIFYFLNFPVSVFRMVFFIKKNKIKVIISPGPGCAISAGLASKISGIKFIYIESWSRFTTLSLAGKFCRYMCNEFFVQNESMLKIMPNARFVGRL